MDAVARSIAEAKKAASNLTISLQVVSPSVGVPRTLEFHDLPVNTQVKELKNLIRDTLVSQPSDDLQRLIYHGRMLTRDTETMLEIFGEEALRSSVFQVIHLVLRPLSENMETATCTDTRGIHVPAIPISVHNSRLQLAEQTLIPGSLEVNQHEVPRDQQATSGLQCQLQQNVSCQLEKAQTVMGQKMIQLQLDTQKPNQETHEMEDQVILRTGSTESRPKEQEIQNPTAERIPGSLTPPDRQSSDLKMPSPFKLGQDQDCYSPYENKDHQSERNSTNGTTATISRQESVDTPRSNKPANTRETEDWQTTANETTTAIPNQLSSSRHPNYGQLRDPSNGVRSISGNIDRSSTLNQLANITGSSNFSSDNMKSRILSSSLTSTATPSLTTSISLNTCSNSSDKKFTLGSDQSANIVDKKPLVYILSSPSGPSAILISSTQKFYTPSHRSSRLRYSVNSSLNSANQFNFSGHDQLNRQQDREPRNLNERAAELRQAGPQANFRVGGIGIQIAQILWLIIRLVGFVWFFTAGNPSWTRWFMASGLAFIIFIILTGILNRLIDRLWSPIRRHLEALVPLGPVHPQNIPLNVNRAQGLVGDDDRALPRQLPGARNINRDERGRVDPNPAVDAGIRIEQQTQSNSGLLMTQVRRLEQALILFVASLVPGVSERHIAHREAQANREAERQQELFESAHINIENSPSTESQDTDNIGKSVQDENTPSPINEQEKS